MSKGPDRKHRRRTCADRMRRDLAQRQRHRGKDPATSLFLQLLAVLSAALVVFPPIPEPSFGMRNALRRRQPIRAPDDDRGPTAHAMERGIDRAWYPTTSRVSPSWSRLVKNLKRRSTAAEARVMIEHRVPPAAVEWVRTQIDLEQWTSLRMLAPPGSSDEEISAHALAEASKWEAAKPKPFSGGAGAEEQPEPDDDEPKGPKR